MGEKRITTNKGHPVPADQASITTREGLVIDVASVKEQVSYHRNKGWRQQL